MRRLALAVATALLCGTPPPATAAYAGHVRSASATFRFLGVDGHRITVAVTLRSSGLGGSAQFREAELRFTDCAGKRCATSPLYVMPYTAEQEAADLSVTKAELVVGSTSFAIGWYSDAGYGALPPEPDTSDGVALTTRRAATAVVVVGTLVDGKVARRERCVAEHAAVASTLVAQTSERPNHRLPRAVPPGLRAKAWSHRTFTCA